MRVVFRSFNGWRCLHSYEFTFRCDAIPPHAICRCLWLSNCLHLLSARFFSAPFIQSAQSKASKAYLYQQLCKFCKCLRPERTLRTSSRIPRMALELNGCKGEAMEVSSHASHSLKESCWERKQLKEQLKESSWKRATEREQLKDRPDCVSSNLLESFAWISRTRHCFYQRTASSVSRSTIRAFCSKRTWECGSPFGDHSTDICLIICDRQDVCISNEIRRTASSLSPETLWHTKKWHSLTFSQGDPFWQRAFGPKVSLETFRWWLLAEFSEFVSKCDGV